MERQEFFDDLLNRVGNIKILDCMIEQYRAYGQGAGLEDNLICAITSIRSYCKVYGTGIDEFRDSLLKLICGNTETMLDYLPFELLYDISINTLNSLSQIQESKHEGLTPNS